MESIENRLDKKTKLKEGIFFTSPSVVEEISRIFDYGSVKSVIDSAAGSCNFLIPLARQYSHIQFYGVEKNETIYETVKTDIEDLPNLHYYRGDILLDDLPVPPVISTWVIPPL
jgi:type I restriction-modification system DNA methylase subunit